MPSPTDIISAAFMMAEKMATTVLSDMPFGHLGTGRSGIVSHKYVESSAMGVLIGSRNSLGSEGS
jgi:hypothetical protein